MRIDWQALAPNPWFQLCALVAVLSGGMTIYNFTQHSEHIGGGGATPPPNPPPISITTPTPVPTLKAKAPGHWIVDANGAADADSRDLRTVVANLVDGDSVSLRPGIYQGGFNVSKSVHFIGQGANPASVSIHTSFQDTITVSGKNVSFENLTINLDSPGDELHALHCVGASHVELNRVLVDSKALYAARAIENASLDAHDSTFQTARAGCGLDYENNAHGSLVRCAVLSNRWGLQVLNSARAQASFCSFQNNGGLNGDGAIIVIQGAQTHVDADRCQFTGNTSTLGVSESGSLSIVNSLFKGNGLTGEQGNTSNGVIGVTSSGKATLSNVTFEFNKQGISVKNGGSVTISGCHISKTGIHTENADFKYLSIAIAVSGKGSSAIVNQGTTIIDSTAFGIVSVQGAQLTLDDAGVSGSGEDGLYVGNTDGGATADVRRGKFDHNQNAIVFGFGSTGTIQDCQLTANYSCGVSLTGANTKVSVVNSEFRANKNYGLLISGLAEGQATGCLIDGSERGAQVGFAGNPNECGTMTMDNCTITNNSILGIAACVKSTMIYRDLHFSGNPQKSNMWRERNSIVREDIKNMLVR